MNKKNAIQVQSSIELVRGEGKLKIFDNVPFSYYCKNMNLRTDKSLRILSCPTKKTKKNNDVVFVHVGILSIQKINI